jgi:carboxypeptidase family protein
MTTPYWRRSVVGILVAVVTFLICGAPASAQQTLGSINGTVLDPAGASVPDATITVTDSQIDLLRTTKSQSSGFFQIFNLPIGTYKVKITHDGFETTDLSGIEVQEARATTVNGTLKVGQVSESVEVTANPLLNATDATNGYTLDSSQIAETPLATGSFTQLAVLAPGVNAELLSGLDSNSGLGNQPIWANGQRDTSNTFQVNGVDVTNLFNGKSTSGSTSQRYNFNIGAGSTSSTSAAGGATVGGANPTGTSVYGSNGNSLPSPVPEFTQEIRVNTSMYDAQQGATSGAQIDVNTATGTNTWHGQLFGTFANNSLNAAPFFFKQSYLLDAQGVGAFPESLVNPPLHRWSTGATVGGPIFRNKLFFFLGYQHRYNSDQATGLTQFTVPVGLTSDRSDAGLTAAATAWNGGTAFTGTISPIASALLNATLPNGQFLIPSAQSSAPYQYGVPNVTLSGTSILVADQATSSLDYDLSHADRLSFKYYYQNDPVSKPYGYAQTGGFPVTQNNGAQVGAIGNTIAIGPRLNWEQRLGYARMRSYSHYTQTLVNSAGDPAFGIGSGITGYAAGLPGLLLESFASSQVDSPSVKVGPYSSFANIGYAQNRLNPSTNVIFAWGKHTIVAGGGYSYTQLNIDNNRTGLAQVKTKNFQTFLEGQVSGASVLESIAADGKNNADRYYRSNEFSGYVQDKWQALSNLSITGGIRYDYHGGLTEKYGNLFNFDPSLYDVTGSVEVPGSLTVNNAGFVIAHNNKLNTDTADDASNDSTLSGRQWGISPRVGFAWAPKQNAGRIVFRGGFGLYFDRGELFSYLSQPAGSGNGGPFGVTESAPLASFVQASSAANGSLSLTNPLGSQLTGSAYVAPSSNPASIKPVLQSLLNVLTGNATGYDSKFGLNCGAIDNQEGYTDCPVVLNFGAYGKDNVLPYTINMSFNMQWQPSNDVAITIGYTGNRGRHGVIPIPLNEPQIATPSNHAQIGGKEPGDSGEQYSYGFQVLNQNSFSGYDYNSIAKEKWNSEDGGNTDMRVPYLGYSPNAALFRTVGNSAYDALETHVEKRLSHNFQFGVSYTWSHTLDEQSDIGLFFTGNDPNNLRNSYASSDFDRTHVFSANFQAETPNIAKAHSALSYLTNDWHLTGVGILQSGEPYSLYEFYGAVASLYYGDFPTLLNPILPVKDPANVKRQLTGNSGQYRGSGGSYIPYIDPSQVAINYITPESSEANGVPYSTGSDPQDVYETNFAPSNQRNIFRQSPQKRLDISLRKSFRPAEKLNLQYEFNVFNLTNTTSLDVPQDQAQIRQNSACSTSAATEGNNCEPGKYYYVNYGQIVTSASAVDQASTKANLDQIPYSNGTGKSTSIPTLIPVGTRTCASVYAVPGGCPNNAANFGSITGTIGGARAITMGLHVTF